MGCDAWQTVRALQVYNFNPRSPNGLRLIITWTVRKQMQFQSTQPEWAATYLLDFIVDGE